jgi:hypothetical protein
MTAATVYGPFCRAGTGFRPESVTRWVILYQILLPNRLMMSREEYLQKSADIKQRLDFARWGIDAHVRTFGSNAVQQIKPLLKLQNEIIIELTALDKDYFRDA